MHIDVKYLPQMADESRRRYLFVAIDRATRWVFIRIFNAKTAANARRFLRDHQRACPMRIRTILTDNGKEFTDRLFGLRKRAATGEHEFDKLCAALNIDHRLTPPKSPQTNGMVERFNGRIEEVLQSHHFRSGEELETTLHRYVWLYNQQLPQSALGSKTPLQTMKEWHKIKPELFWKQPNYLPGCDSQVHARDGGFDIVEDDAPQTLVRDLEKAFGCNRDWQVHGERHGKALEQQREAGARPRPRYGDEAHATLGTVDAWRAYGQERLMLEEIEMPPGLRDGVMHRTRRRFALRALKAAAGFEVDPDIEAAIVGVEV